MMITDWDDEVTCGNLIRLLAMGLVGVALLVGVAWGFFALNRHYDVWAQRKGGEAELARAESNRQIKTLEAKAQMEGAKYLAEAEIIRSQGVAEANRIIGDSLRENEGYLQYLWIQNLAENKGNTVYIPTECGLPILEANRLK